MQLKKQRLDLTQAHSNAQVVIILANQMPWSKWFEPMLAQVGTLPVLLRAILGVQSHESGTHCRGFQPAHGAADQVGIAQDATCSRRP